jgi:hypothetical protein
MNRQDEIWTQIQATLPEVEADVLAAMLDKIMEGYATERGISRDTMPTKPQMQDALHDIHSHLWAIASRLMEDDGPMIAGWLGAELDQENESSATFINQVVEMLEATERSIGHVEKSEHTIVNDKPHTRRTRTAARDKYLIPMLTGATMQVGMDPSNDWEDLDRACRFVGLVLEHAGIDAPDAGKDVDRHGEQAQGRLRRMIKDAARLLTNKGIKPTP